MELYDLKRRHFLRWAEGKGLHSARLFPEKHYYEYAACLKERGLHESTIYTHLVSLKQVFKWAQREKLTPGGRRQPGRPTEAAQTGVRPPTLLQFQTGGPDPGGGRAS